MYCEGPQLPEPAVTEWIEVPPAATATVTWDARALARSSFCFDCNQTSFQNGIQEVFEWHPQPVGAGAYAGRFKVADTPGPDCDRSGARTWTCPTANFGGFMAAPYGVAELCWEGRAVDVSFSLPASGDLDVPVAIQ